MSKREMPKCSIVLVGQTGVKKANPSYMQKQVNGWWFAEFNAPSNEVGGALLSTALLHDERGWLRARAEPNVWLMPSHSVRIRGRGWKFL